nr:hypothetical protein Iba_chr12cCG18120 [Ipomoea batatas]
MARITETDPDATDTSSDEEKLYERRRKVEKVENEECQKVEKEECQKVENEPSVLPQPQQKVENEEYQKEFMKSKLKPATKADAANAAKEAEIDMKMKTQKKTQTSKKVQWRINAFIFRWEELGRRRGVSALIVDLPLEYRLFPEIVPQIHNRIDTLQENVSSGNLKEISENYYQGKLILGKLILKVMVVEWENLA